MLELIASILLWTVLAAAGVLILAAYFLPTIIVLFRRNHSMVVAVVILNLVVGWTFLGWLIALVLSLATVSSSHQHYYYAYPQPSAYQLVLAARLVEPAANGAAADVTVGDLQPGEDS